MKRLLIIATLFCVAVSCAPKDANQRLAEQAAKEYLTPVHPGSSSQPFWNGFAKKFIYAPAFDFQTVEGAVKYLYKVTAESGEWSGAGSGFAHLHESYASGHNPFSDGTARQVATTNKKDKLSTATWSGSVPKSGVYSLYVSYRTVKKSATDAHYTVHASGGDREFLVNQTMGGGMWLCLGEFYFEAGEERVWVTLDNYSLAGGVVTADAGKIGGGIW